MGGCLHACMWANLLTRARAIARPMPCPALALAPWNCPLVGSVVTLAASSTSAQLVEVGARRPCTRYPSLIHCCGKHRVAPVPVESMRGYLYIHDKGIIIKKNVMRYICAHARHVDRYLQLRVDAPGTRPRPGPASATSFS